MTGFEWRQVSNDLVVLTNTMHHIRSAVVGIGSNRTNLVPFQ
jgi:hypothetical protein